jgi:hypothetical protein
LQSGAGKPKLYRALTKHVNAYKNIYLNKKNLDGRFKLHLTIYLLCVAAGLFFASRFSYADKLQLPGQGDEWDYQSIAVNLVTGNGFPFSGGFEDLRVYKIADEQGMLTGPAVQAQCAPNRTPDFYRNPVYPLFIGAVYKIGSVKPGLLRMVQFVLLILSGSLIPYLCYRLWGNKGIITGVLSYLLFLHYDTYFAMSVMCEALVIFYLIVFVLLTVILKPVQKVLHAFIIGACLAFGLLLKNYFAPVAVAAIIYTLYAAIISKNIPKPNMYLFLLGIICMLLPWVIYANLEAGKFASHHPFIFITTQGGDVLLGSNNEYSADGLWHPEWFLNPTAFYKQPVVQNYPSVIQAGGFYFHHLSWIPYFFSSKIMMGLFATMPQLFFYLSSLAFVIVRDVRKKILFPIIAMLFLLLVLYGQANIHALLIQLSNSVLNAHHALRYVLIIFTGIVLYRYLSMQTGEKRLIAYPLLLMLANFTLLTLLFYGNSRITGVVDFICIILAVNNVMEIISMFMVFKPQVTGASTLL